MNPMTSSLWPLLAFLLVVALIPLALWLMRRSGIAGTGQPGLMRTVSSLALSPSQKVVVVELGQADTAYRDRPPRAFLWVWPLLNIVANTVGVLVQGARADALRARLREVTAVLQRRYARASPGGLAGTTPSRRLE